VALAPDAIAFRSLASGTCTSYAELEHRAQKSAGLMRSLGMRAGDRVAVLCRNRVEFFETLFACAKIGAVMVPLNWRMPTSELAPLVRELAPALLLFSAEDRATVRNLDCTEFATLDFDTDGAEGFAARCEAATPVLGRDSWPVGECWYLLLTSGTTGTPKAVIQTYGMAIANYVNIRQAMAISAGDVTLNFLPLFHAAGINLVTLPTLLEGGEVMLLPGFELEAMIDLLREARIDTFFAVPAVYQQISQHPEFDSLNLGRIRSWGCGGSALAPELVDRFLTQGAQVRNGMGMTETGPTVFLMDADNVARKPGSIGKPQLLSCVRIVNAEGDDVQPGEKGEVWYAGPGVTPGYWSNQHATREAFSPDGWLRSGDIAYQDAEGYYFVVGRQKDMYISGGENVFPAEVENILAAHPDILEVAVTARSDEKWGEVGCAWLLLAGGGATPSDRELRDYCRARLAPYKVPKYFVMVDDFPRTAVGKIQKHLLEPS
jgi:fatty-acyl-CoA synthase